MTDDKLRAALERAANMGSCSQTHHEHIARECAEALAASATDERNRRLSEAMTTPAPPSTSRLAASATDE